MNETLKPISSSNATLENNEQKENVIKALMTAIENGETQNSLAKQVGISSAALSQFLSGSYKGNNEALTSKLESYFEHKKRTVNIKKAPTFVETPTSKKIFNSLDYAKAAGCFVVVYGNSGVGKTGALAEYANQPNVWMITARPSSAKLLECLYDIAGTLEMEYTPRRSGLLSSAIQRRLKNTGGLLIIDEADHLPYEVLEEIRLIQEITGVGVVLCGNHQIYAKLSGGGSRKTDFARLFSRVAKRVAILKTTSGDIDAIIDAWGVTGERERKLIHAIGQKAGALRTIKTALSLAAILASSSNSEIKEAHIKAAIKDLEGVE